MSAAFEGRSILARHRDFSLYRPTAYVVARMLVDIPNTVLQASFFSIIFYFMVGFQVNAAKFFTFWILTIISALCFVSYFRMIGSLFKVFDNASKVGGFSMTVMAVYGGYFIPFNQMHPWLKWLFWLNPAGYGYEAIIANEFQGLTLSCVGEQLIPHGESYAKFLNRACTIAGASTDGTAINGAEYLYKAYEFSASHIWRNFGTFF
jgi:ATP-binding cassette subfamily G (WHITE) protein 2 (SNQ2)